jgi:hypothetical protein
MTLPLCVEPRRRRRRRLLHGRRGGADFFFSMLGPRVPLKWLVASSTEARREGAHEGVGGEGELPERSGAGRRVGKERAVEVVGREAGAKVGSGARYPDSVL